MKHLIAGALVAGISLVICPSPGTGTIWALAVGAAKEYYDYLSNMVLEAQGMKPTHEVDINDLLATVAGGLLVDIYTALLMLMAIS